MNFGNVFIQIFHQIAVGVVGVLISLLHGIFELETVVVGRSGGSIVHPVQLVAVEREGQVVNEPVAACSRLPIPLQSEYVPVLVVTCHFLGEAVCVAAYRSTFAIDGIQHAVQPVVSELIAAECRLISGFPGHAADVAVVAGRAVAGVVIQVLRELASADGCQPAAEVVAVGQLGGGNAVWCPGLQAAQVIVGAGHEGHLRSAAGLELGGQQSPRMVVRVAVNLGLPGLAGGRMHPAPLYGVAHKVVGHVFNVRSAQGVGRAGLDDASAVVVVVQSRGHRARQQSLAAARVADAIARGRRGIRQRGGHAVCADEAVVVVVVHPVDHGRGQADSRNVVAVEPACAARGLDHRIAQGFRCVGQRVGAYAVDGGPSEGVGQGEGPAACTALHAVLCEDGPSPLVIDGVGWLTARKSSEDATPQPVVKVGRRVREGQDGVE